VEVVDAGTTGLEAEPLTGAVDEADWVTGQTVVYNAMVSVTVEPIEE